MSYYCGECVVWVGSSDVDRYGRRWCAYSRRYEESNQNTYGCKGFVYNGRTILTKVCELLGLSKDEWFAAFDEAKDGYAASHHMEWLTSYCSLGPAIAKALENDQERITVSKEILKQYLVPARNCCKQRQFDNATKTYRNMVLDLAERYGIVYG